MSQFDSTEPEINLGISNAAFDDFGKDEDDGTGPQVNNIAQNAL